MDYIAQPKDYWIAQNAVNITRNALGKPCLALFREETCPPILLLEQCVERFCREVMSAY